MATIRLQPDRIELDWDEGETLLQALERAGFPLPSDCRAGTCGTCRARTLAGEVEMGVYLPLALPDEQAEQGYVLTCIAEPRSDLVELDYGEALANAPDVPVEVFPPREDVGFVVVDKVRRTPSIVELRLRPIGDRLRYWPGQYVMLRDADGQVPPRSYSIANAPRRDGEIVLIVARAEGGTTSGWVHDDVAPGDTVVVSGAYGTFIGDPEEGGPVLCMAGGSGLAPILSLTDAALGRGYADPVTLLFSATTEHDVYHEGLITLWEERHDNFRFVRTVTHPRGDAAPPTGHIPDILSDLFDDLADFQVFIAGAPSFVEACARAARDLGATDARIHTENYFAGGEDVGDR